MTGTTVSGAELKVQLTGLGLTPAWFAERLQVTPRTVTRWFGLDAIPRYAVTELELIREATTTAVHEAAIAGAADGVLHTQRTDGVQELNTFPATWHRALTFRALTFLRSSGHPVRVAYMPRQAS